RERGSRSTMFVYRSLFRYAKIAQQGNHDVKIGRQAHRTSAICASNEDTILVRGRDLAGELIGNVNFTDYFWLLVTGVVPSAAQRRVLDATLVAIAEHGLVPSVQASRMTLAAAPEAFQGAVAAGLLGCGSVVLGSSEAAGRFFSEIATRVQAAAGAAGAIRDPAVEAGEMPIEVNTEGALEQAASAVIQEYR